MLEYGYVSRCLKSRHIQFISLGGTIGTGLFLGIGSAFVSSGPGVCVDRVCFDGRGTVRNDAMLGRDGYMASSSWRRSAVLLSLC